MSVQIEKNGKPHRSGDEVKQQMNDKLKALEESFHEALKDIDTEARLADIKARFLGKKGELSAILKSLGQATPEERKTLGQAANELKGRLTEKLDEARASLERGIINSRLAADWTDITLLRSLRSESVKESGLHPVSIVQRELEDIFLSMGFDILDGPHIENDWYNFTALNIPETHPARDMQDTFWFKGHEAPAAYTHLHHPDPGHGREEDASLQVRRPGQGVPLRGHRRVP